MGKKMLAILGTVSLVFLAAAVLLQIFVVIAGVPGTNVKPFSSTYFLQADTSSIPGAERPLSQYTLFYVCGEGNTNCGSPVPGVPTGYAWVGGSEGAPAGLIGSSAKNTTNSYYYALAKAGFWFYIAGFAGTVFGFMFGLIAPFARLGSAFAALWVFGAMLLFGIGAALETALCVKARQQFIDAGLAASIGRYALGFTWGSFAALLVAFTCLFFGFLAGKSDSTSTTRKGSRVNFFRRNRSKRSTRGSFIDNESQRRVKDEYA